MRYHVARITSRSASAKEKHRVRRSRIGTGSILHLVAFIASYGWMIRQEEKFACPLASGHILRTRPRERKA